MCNKSRIKFLSAREATAVAMRQTYFDNLTKTDCMVLGVNSGAEFLHQYIRGIGEFTETERELITAAVINADRRFKYGRAWRFMRCTGYEHAHTFEDVIVLNDCNNIYRKVMHERIHVYQRYVNCVGFYRAIGYLPYLYTNEMRNFYRLRSNPDADEYVYRAGDVLVHARYRDYARSIDDTYGLDHPNELAAYALVEFLFDGVATDFQLLLP